MYSSCYVKTFSFSCFLAYGLRIVESGVDILYLISVEHKEQLHYLKISGRDYDRDGRGGGYPLELESKVPEDFTIMTLAPKQGI